MPDVNHHSVSELREHARFYIRAVRTDAPENLTHNAQMLANLVERLLDEDGLPDADNPDSVKPEPVTVDEIVRRIEEHLTTELFDAVNGIGDNFIVWSGEPSNNPGSRDHADHITIHGIEWDDGQARAHLLPGDRDRIIRALRSTATFTGWSQSANARKVLAASGLDGYTPDELDTDMSRRALFAGLTDAERGAADALAERLNGDSWRVSEAQDGTWSVFRGDEYISGGWGTREVASEALVAHRAAGTVKPPRSEQAGGQQ